MMRAAMKARARKDFIATVPGYSVPLILGFTLWCVHSVVSMLLEGGMPLFGV